MSIYGATREEWKRLSNMGIVSELLPIVCNPHAVPSELSKLRYPGKLPTKIVKKGEFSGIHEWPKHKTTKAEAIAWSKEEDHGIGIQTRIIRAFDVDVTDQNLANEIESFIENTLGIELPIRRRSDSPKFLFAFKCNGNFPKRDVVVRILPDNKVEKIEFLATGQQFKAYGTYLKGDGTPPTGCKLEWDWKHYIDQFPEISENKADELWASIIKRFGLSIPTRDGYKNVRITENKHRQSIFPRENFTQECVKDMLSHISPDVSYDIWYKIATALQDGGYPFHIWNDWSSGGKKYRKEEMIPKWNSFTPGRGISIGTLVYLAKEAGWSPRQEEYHHTPLKEAVINPTTGEKIEIATQKNVDICPTINAANLQGVEIPERRWVIKEWVQKGSVTALYGDGGVGKSLISMQIMTCIALGIPFLGLETTKEKVFGFFCEDSEEELHRRQDDINCHYNINFNDLHDVYWQSRVGYENTLMSFVRDGLGSPAEAYAILRAEVLRIGAKLVVIDTAADTFGGNENIRPQVRQFINLLSKLALEIDGAILLCAHPSAAGLSRNDGTGGSTAWNNTVRSRLYISRPVKDKDSQDQNDEYDKLREFSKMKSNYSSRGDAISLQWEHGAFKVIGESIYDKVSEIDKSNQAKNDEIKFLALLGELNRQGRVVSESKNSSSFAPKIMTQMEGGKAISRSRFIGAMERLFATGKIKIDAAGLDTWRHKKNGIVIL